MSPDQTYNQSSSTFWQHVYISLPIAIEYETANLACAQSHLSANLSTNLRRIYMFFNSHLNLPELYMSSYDEWFLSPFQHIWCFIRNHKPCLCTAAQSHLLANLSYSQPRIPHALNFFSTNAWANFFKFCFGSSRVVEGWSWEPQKKSFKL